VPASWPDRSDTLDQTSREASINVQGVQMRERQRMRSTVPSARRSQRHLLTQALTGTDGKVVAIKAKRR
jgi:hypothetical protein